MQNAVGAASFTPAAPINENTPKTNGILRNNRKKETGSEQKIEEETKEMLQTNDLNYFENWRNKSIENTKKIKKSKYTQSNEEFETALSGQNLTVPKQQLIRNGSLKPFLYINQKKVRVKNTCSFDSIVSCVANTYIQVDSYRQFVNSSENLLMKTAKFLAETGASKETYRLRAKALISIFEPENILPKINRCNQRKIIYSCEYDSWSNLATILKKLLPDLPSAEIVSKCQSPSCEGNSTQAYVCVDVNCHVIINEGMKSIHKAIWKPKTDSAVVSEQIGEVAKEISGPCKFLCGHQVTNTFLGKQHVFIDTDFLGQNIPTLEEGYDNQRHALRDMPLQLKFAGKL
ncbi:hypothetical protein J6590_068100 [Homalodisca vitripennis]|nr:hypothetical protein J6590_068100 [Homalodisca vitripennis]